MTRVSPIVFLLASLILVVPEPAVANASWISRTSAAESRAVDTEEDAKDVHPSGRVQRWLGTAAVVSMLALLALPFVFYFWKGASGTPIVSSTENICKFEASAASRAAGP
jgi:hypothetical protein